MALSQLLPEIPGNHSPRCSLPVGFLLQDHTWDPGCEVQGIVLQRFRICRCRQCCFAVLFFSDSKKRRERRGRCSSNLKEETRNYIKYLNLIYIYHWAIYLSIYFFFKLFLHLRIIIVVQTTTSAEFVGGSYHLAQAQIEVS